MLFVNILSSHLLAFGVLLVYDGCYEQSAVHPVPVRFARMYTSEDAEHCMVLGKSGRSEVYISEVYPCVISHLLV